MGDATTLKTVSHFIASGWHARAFEALDELHTLTPRLRTLSLLERLLPLSAPGDGFHYGTEEHRRQAQARRVAAVARARAAEPSEGTFELDETALLDAIDALLRPRARSEAELLAAVYADPTSDEARLVLADVLSERGDLRGEFIVLQIASARDKRVTPREKELLKRFGALWLGELRNELAYPTFRRGFVAEGKFVGRSRFESPAWATLETLHFGHATLGRSHLFEPNLRHLKKTCGVDMHQLARAFEQKQSSSVLHLGLAFQDVLPVSAFRAVLPKLTRMDVVYGDAEAALPWAREAGLETVGLNRGPEFLARAYEHVRGSESLTVVLGLRGAWLEVAGSFPAWSLTVRARPKVTVNAALHGDGTLDDLVAPLSTIPVETVTLGKSTARKFAGKPLETFQAALARRGVALA